MSRHASGRPVSARRALPARFPLLGLTVLPALQALAALGAPCPAAAQDLVLTRAHVVDVVSGQVTRDATIVVAGGTIRAVETGQPALPAGARVLDLGGRYVSPGLMDAHVHMGTEDQARRALESGVTTVRSMGAGHFADVGLGKLASGGHVTAPEVRAAGYHVRPDPALGLFLDHPELGRYRSEGVRGPDAVRAVVRALLAHDIHFIKTNATERAGTPQTDPRRQLYGEDEIRVMVEEGAARGVPVAAHAHGDGGARAAVLAGVRSIEHGTYMSEETLRLMAERGTFLVPTLAIVADLTVPGGDYDDPALAVRGRHMLPRVREMARNAHRLGVRIVAATDTGYGPGSTVRLAHELEELVGIGMTPLQALRAATVDAAELLGVGDRTGRIAPGLEADLVVTERNPLEDVGTLQDVLLVVSDGRVVAERGDWPEPPVS